jgi:predicted GH43/DUF377 family glycosyl hydrolase
MLCPSATLLSSFFLVLIVHISHCLLVVRVHAPNAGEKYYLLHRGHARHIIDEVTITSLGFQVDDLINVSSALLSEFRAGEPVPRLFLADHSPDELMRFELQRNSILQEELLYDFVSLGEAENPVIQKWNGRFLMITSLAWGIVEGQVADGIIRYKWFNHSSLPFYSNEPYLGISTKTNFLADHEAKDALPGVDPRVLVLNSSHLWITFNNNHGRVSMGVAELALNASGSAKISFHCDGIQYNSIEKNWVAFQHNDAVLYVQRINPFHVVATHGASNAMAATTFSLHHEVQIPWWHYGEFRGGTNALLIGDVYLAFFHSSTQLPGNYMKTYFMGAYTFTSKPPFKLVAMSEVPIMHNFLYTGAWSQFKNRRIDYVVFPTNFFVEDGVVHLSLGFQDREGLLVKINLEKLQHSLKIIPESPIS